MMWNMWRSRGLVCWLMHWWRMATRICGSVRRNMKNMDPISFIRSSSESLEKSSWRKNLWNQKCPIWFSSPSQKKSLFLQYWESKVAMTGVVNCMCKNLGVGNETAPWSERYWPMKATKVWGYIGKKSNYNCPMPCTLQQWSHDEFLDPPLLRGKGPM